MRLEFAVISTLRRGFFEYSLSLGKVDLNQVGWRGVYGVGDVKK